MKRFVAGAAAGYVLGTKAGRKRYHQIVNAAQAVLNSPLTKQATTSARRALANTIDPDPRMREVKDANAKRSRRSLTGKRGKDTRAIEDQILEPETN